jgi:hypothetical protein
MEYIFYFYPNRDSIKRLYINPRVLAVIIFAKSLWLVAAKFYLKFRCLSPTRKLDGSPAIIQAGKHYTVITQFGYNYLIKGSIVYFFWNSGDAKKNY